MYRQVQRLKWIDNLSRTYGIFLVPENVQIIPTGYVSKMQLLWRNFVSVSPSPGLSGCFLWAEKGLSTPGTTNTSALWAYYIIWFDVVLKKTTVYPSVSQRQLRPHVWVAHSCPWVADGRGNSPGKKPPRPPPCIKNKAHNAQQDMWDPPSHPYLPCPLPRIYFLTSKYMPAP